MDSITRNTPKAGKAFDSADVLSASPVGNMPARNTEFTDIRDVQEVGTPLSGKYGSEWKVWGNPNVNNASLAAEEGRRYTDTDNVCQLRNMFVTVMATAETAELLLQVEAKPFLAKYLQGSFILACLTAMGFYSI